MQPSAPRNLTILRIIDSGSYDAPLEADAPRNLSPLVVEQAEGEMIHRITGCVASQRFWQSLRTPATPPDLLIVDINFEKDLTSPLRNIETKIPTGLLHALPFLAWARTSGRMVAVAFQTGDEHLFTTDGSDATPIMKLLAAELAGLAGSIAGSIEHGKVVDGNLDRLPSNPNGDRECAGYRWLLTVAARQEHEARAFALQDYRKQLSRAVSGSVEGVRTHSGRLIIDPEAHATLLQEVHRAASRSDHIKPTKENWPGLTVVREDGSKDCLSIESLFADALSSLKARHFAVGAAPGDALQPWRTNDGEPAIGEYLQSLGDWVDVMEQASAFAMTLPLGDTAGSTSLNQLVHPGAIRATTNAELFMVPVKHYKLVRFLTLAFQIVRQFHHAHATWPDRYSKREWDPIRLCLGAQDVGSRKSLAAHLANLIAGIVKCAIADRRTLWIDSADLTEILLGELFGMRGTARETARRDIAETGYRELLIEHGILKATATENAAQRFEVNLATLDSWGATRRSASNSLRIEVDIPTLRSRLELRIPREPIAFHAPWISHLRVATTALQATLGFKRETGPLTRVISEGLQIPHDKSADFLREFQNGAKQFGWLRVLCRQFATKTLNWVDEKDWPRCLQNDRH